LAMADRQQKLGISKQLGNLVQSLVTQMLAHSFVDHRLVRVAGIRTFRLDDDHGDTVYKADSIRTAGMGALGGEDFHLFGNMEAVGSVVLPVDQLNGGLVFLAVSHELG